MAKGFWVKVKPQADFYGTATWKAVSNIWVKTTSTSWQSVSDMWVKVKPQGDFYGTATWKALYSAGTAPDTPIQLLTSYNSTELLRLQGRNYHWSPTPTTLQYKFVSVDVADSMVSDITDWVTTTNPSSGSSVVLPTASTYVTIAKDAPYIYAGTTNRIQFVVKGTTSSGLTFTFKDEYSLVLPKAPTVTATAISSTQVRLNITRNSSDAAGVANRYIVYLWDGTQYRYAGNTVGITGLGGYGVSETGNEITIGGLSPSIQYSFIVTPITGSVGSTLTNYYGYAGLEGTADSETISPYTFTFGKVLHVGTNGYIGLDAGATSDSILSAGTGRFLGIFPGDLSQLSATSIWYWSNTAQFIIRWEGHVYGQASQTRAYQVTFYKDQSYATVYVLDATGGTTGTQAMVKDNTLQTSYPSNPATGSSYNVYFDGTTTPVTFLGASEKSKGVMVQASGLSSGSLDQGYTSITTSTNQSVTPTLGAFNISSFTKGLVSSSSQGASRSTTLTWGASTNATKYQVQYQGSNDNTNWTTVRAYSATYNITGTTDTKTWSTSGGDFGYYTFMRANVRSLEDSGSATYVYSDNAAYVEASGTAPGDPTFGTITKTSATASIPVTAGTQGTNYLYSSIEYMYRTSAGSYGSTWSTATLTNGSATISLTGLSASTSYYIKIRTKNYDELYSAEKETTFDTTAGLTSPTITSVTYSGGTYTINFDTTVNTGPKYQLWYQSSNSTTPSLNGTVGSSPDASGSSSPITKDITLTAGYSIYWWIRSSSTLTSTGAGNVSDWAGPVRTTRYTVSFNANSGSSTPSDLTQATEASSVTLPAAITRTGYAFGGWNTASDGSGTNSTAGSAYTPASSLTLYAKWTQLYTITFNSQSGTAVSALTQASAGGSIAKPTDPTRTGYTFGGWATSSSGTTAVTWPRTPTADETLYAIWSTASTLYTVTFSANGATGSPSVSSVAQTTADGAVTLATKGTMAGGTNRIFGGWRTGTSSGTVYAFGSSYTPTANITLYAYYGTSPTCVAPSVTFKRYPNDSSSSWEYFADYPTPSGAYTVISGMEFDIYTTQTGSTNIAGGTGTIAYPTGSDLYPFYSERNGTWWSFRVGSGLGGRVATTSARWGRFRVIMTGIDGLSYQGTWTARS